MQLARWLLNAAPADIGQYKPLLIAAYFLASLLNSGPKVVHTFPVRCLDINIQDVA